MPLYGLIGQSLSHSRSPELFEKLFEEHDVLNGEYKLFQIDTIKQLTSILKTHKNLLGFNVTIPYKTQILSSLYEIDKSAVDCWAVNTVKVTRVKDRILLKGYNTDMPAFKETIEPLLKGSENKALIFGTGGAAKAARVAFTEMNIEVTSVSRQQKFEFLKYEELNESIFKNHNIIVNCTPIGTHPNLTECLPINFDYINENHLVYDMVYNPEQTELLKRAAHNGATIKNGLEMLKLQAQKAWHIWNH